MWKNNSKKSTNQNLCERTLHLFIYTYFFYILLKFRENVDTRQYKAEAAEHFLFTQQKCRENIF